MKCTYVFVVLLDLDLADDALAGGPGLTLVDVGVVVHKVIDKDADFFLASVVLGVGRLDDGLGILQLLESGHDSV